MNIWKFFNELEHLQSDLQKVGKGLGFGRIPRSSFFSGLTQQCLPLVNILEENDKVLVEALTPGVDPATLNVSIANNALTISGEKPELKVKLEDFHRSERGAGKFIRTIDLPCEVEATKVSAEYKNGILLVTIPKAEAAKPRNVEVKVS